MVRQGKGDGGVLLSTGIDDYLPGAKIIGAEVEVPDMKWIWEVLGLVISLGS